MTTLTGTVTLSWRERDLYAGRVYVGCIWPTRDGQWGCALGTIIRDLSLHEAESEARSALETAVRRALMGEEAK